MIQPLQIRAARSILGWTQSELAKRAGTTQSTIASIELEKQRPHQSTIDQIFKTFQNAGIEFMVGGARKREDFITILDGTDAYVRLLQDVYYMLKPLKGEVLFNSSDERLSSEEVNHQLRRLRQAGIRMRSIIAATNSYIVGPLEEYRVIPEKYVGSNVNVIYGNKVAYILEEPDTFRVLILTSSYTAADMRRSFNYIWDSGEKPVKTEARISYDH